MINNSVVGFMIRPDAFRPCLETWRVFVKVCNYTATTHRIGRGTIVFATATVGSVGRDSRGLVNTAATILMLVAMLSSLACAGEPFKAELIFCEFHINIYMVGRVGFEPTTLFRDWIMSPGPATNTASIPVCLLY